MTKIIIEGQPEVLVEFLDLINDILADCEIGEGLIQVTTEE